MTPNDHAMDMDIDSDGEYEYETEETFVLVSLNELESVDFSAYRGDNGVQKAMTTLLSTVATNATAGGISAVPLSADSELPEMKVTLKNFEECESSSADAQPQVQLGPFQFRGEHELNIGSMLFFRVTDPVSSEASSSGQQQSSSLAKVEFVGDSISNMRCTLTNYKFDEDLMKRKQEEEDKRHPLKKKTKQQDS